MKQIDVRGCLEALQKDFALAPIDKASNSAVIIHKRCYVEVILNEIGVIGMDITLNAKLIKVGMR